MNLKYQKKILFILLITVISSFLFISQISTVNAGLIAPDKYDQINQETARTGDGIWRTRTTEDFYTLVASIIKVVLGLVGIAFFIYFLYGSYLWMTAAGNDTKIANAKKILINAVIGVILTSFAYVLAYYIALYIEQGGVNSGSNGNNQDGDTTTIDIF